MNKEMIFFIYLLERYAQYKHITANHVLQQLDELQLTQFVYDMYEMYHSESIQNAFDDIDRLIKETKELP